MTGQHRIMPLKIKRKYQRLFQKALSVANAQIALIKLQRRAPIQRPQAVVTVHAGNRHRASQRFPAKAGYCLYMQTAAAEYHGHHPMAHTLPLCKHHTVLPQTAIIGQTAEENNFPARGREFVQKGIDIQMKPCRNQLYRCHIFISLQHGQQIRPGFLTVTLTEIIGHYPDL